MTASDMPSRIAMPCPFAKNGTLGTIDNTSSTNMNYSDGFPTVYGAPSANSGKFVTRGEINRLGNIATNDMFYLKCGGLNTYDANFAQAIGGYPKGAVVIYLTEARELFYAISLVDNNLANLNETHNDNVNWAYLNQNDAKADTNATVEVATMYFNQATATINYSGTSYNCGTTSSPAQIFYAKFSGSLSISNKTTFTRLEKVSGNIVYLTGFSTNSLMIADLGTSQPSTISYPTPTSFGDWKALLGSSLRFVNATSPSQFQSPDTFSGIIQAGHYYALCFVFGVDGYSFGSSGYCYPSNFNGGTVDVNIIRFSY